MRFLVLLLFCPLLVPASSAQDSDNPDTLLNQALYLGDLYNWADATPLFSRAEELYTARGDKRNTLYSHLGLIRSSMEQRSLPETSEELGQQLDTNPLLQSDTPLRLFCLVVRGDIDGELDAEPMRRDWEAVLELANELKDKKWQNRASGEIGFALFLEGDIQTARQKVAGALIAATTNHDTGAQIRYLAAIGTGLVLVGSYGEAVGYFDKALTVAAANPDTGYQFLIYEGRLQALKGMHRLDAAQQLAEDIITEARSRKRYVKETQALITASGIALAQNRYPDAIEQLRAAINLAVSGGFQRLLAAAEFDLADIYRKAGDQPKAEAAAEAAVAATQASGELYLLPNRLRGLAELETSQGKYQAADATYDRASYFVDAMIGNVSAISAKTGLITAMSQIYTEHFALLADRLNKPVKAYEVLEHARGRVIADLLMKGKLRGSEQERTIEHRIGQLNLQLTKAKSIGQVRRLRDEIFISEQARWLAPLAPNAWRAQPSAAIPLTRIRSMLKPGQLMLEYVMAEPRSYCLVISRNQVRIVPLAGRDTIEKLIAAYLKTLKERGVSQTEGQQLYSALLRKVPEVQSSERLIIVPDGQLHLLSFDALVSPSGRYLVSTHTITYAVSASALYLINAMSPSQISTRDLLGVGGIPYDQMAALTKVAATRGYTGAEFGNLPGSKEEVLAADAAVHSNGNTLLIGTLATESAFKQSHLSEYKIIHLAVHGVANPQHPDRAALILLSDAGAGEDGILQASEIVHLRTNADLVVLSACDTAVGRLQGEEGIANLSRAFLLAGARTVVSTL